MCGLEIKTTRRVFWARQKAALAKAPFNSKRVETPRAARMMLGQFREGRASEIGLRGDVWRGGAGQDEGHPDRLTVPHEFDMQVQSGHIQGLACSENVIYLSHQTGLAKIDWESAGIGLAYWEYLLPKRLLGR